MIAITEEYREFISAHSEYGTVCEYVAEKTG
jgi:hypothetical protein